MPGRRLPIAGFLLALSTAAGAQPTPLAREIESRISAAALKAGVSFLASDALRGRGTPSPEQEIAAEFIAAGFRRAGLEPAGDDGYFQSAHYSQVVPVTDGLEFALAFRGRQIHARQDCLALYDAAAIDVDGASVIRVEATDSAALGALTSDAVRGKVLLAGLTAGTVRESGVLARLAALAGRVHPAAVVVVRSGIPAAPARSRLRENLATSAVPVLQVWDDEILRAFEAAGAGVAEATVNVHVAVPQTTPVTLRNVIGVMRGSDPALRDTFLLLTAHYDHLGVSTAGEGDRIYNGANDDASGTAALMEIATALAGLGSKPKRSIVFIALFGEEMGLVGSRYYVRHPVFPLPQTLGALNLEQLGRTDVDGGNRVAQLNVTGYEFSNLTAVLRAAGGETGVEVLKDEKNSDPFYLRSDNQAFADGGIPAHTLSVGYVFPDYHAVGDDWPKIDYENLAKITRTIALALRRVSDSAEVPQWNPERPETERYRRARENAPTVLPD